MTRRAEHDWLVGGAPLMLAQGLAQFGDIDVVPDERLVAARRKLGITGDAPDASQLRRLAGETGGWTAVSGNIFATGDRLRLEVRTLDAATSRVLVRASSEIAGAADPRVAFDSLIARVLEPTGMPPGAALANITTRSVDAFRAYARGHELWEQARFRESEAEFMRAVRLDSTFALAWAALATLSASTGGVQAITNPMSPAYRAIEQAARLSDRLPQREGRFIRAMQSVFRGQFGRARQQFDSLFAANPDALDVAFWIASMGVMVPPVDTAARPWRLENSLNRAVRLAELIVDRDPRRRVAYQAGILPYALGAGLWWGDVYGSAREFSSFAAAVMSVPDARGVPVVDADSLVLVPRAVFDSLPPSEQQRLRQASAEKAWYWAQRWLQAGPEDAEAHHLASHAAELRGDYDRALLEVRAADSIGMQSSMDNMPGRRLSLLVLAGRYLEAGAQADSLLAAGALANMPFLRVLDRRRGYGVAALLLSKRWSSVTRMAEVMGAPPTTDRVCASLKREMLGFKDAGIAIAPHVTRAVLDTVRVYADSLRARPTLAPCVDALSSAGYP